MHIATAILGKYCWFFILTSTICDNNLRSSGAVLVFVLHIVNDIAFIYNPNLHAVHRAKEKQSHD